MSSLFPFLSLLFCAFLSVFYASSDVEVAIDLNLNTEGWKIYSNEYGQIKIDLDQFSESVEVIQPDSFLGSTKKEGTKGYNNGNGNFIRSHSDDKMSELSSSKLIVGPAGSMMGNGIPLPFCPAINLILRNPGPVQTICNVIQTIKGICVENSFTLFAYNDHITGQKKGMIQSLAYYDYTKDNRFTDYPQMLKVYNHEGHPDLPLNIPSDILSKERLTYFFYYSLILRLYNNSMKIRSMEEWRAHERDEYPSFNGYEWFNTYYLHEDSPEVRELNGRTCDYFLNTPISYSMIKRMPEKEYDHMIIVFRGTMNAYEWEENFSYSLMHDSRFPGEVTNGFISLLDQMLVEFLPSFWQLYNENYTHKRLKITITGHSMGGALSTLLGGYLAYHHGFEDIELVTLASPVVANREFYEYIDCHLNIRNIYFAGNGFETFNGPNEVIKQVAHKGYTIGDIVPQVYACTELPDCPNIEEGLPLQRNAQPLNRGPFGGMIYFTADDMPNTVQWKRNSDLVFQLENFAYGWMILSAHFCGYMCYLAQDLGDEIARNYCNFPGQEIEGSHNFCNVLYDPTYPRFYGTSEQIEWARNSAVQPLVQSFRENGIF